MTCEQFKEMAAAYALGILDEEERQACALHLESERDHRGCQAALREAEQVSAHLGAALPAGSRPPSGVWRAIDARLSPGSRPAPPDRAARVRAVRELAAWFIAAAVLGLYLYSGHLDTRRRAAAAGEAGPRSGSPSAFRAAVGLLGQPGTRVLPFRPATTGHPARASLVVGDAPDAQAVVLGDRLGARAGAQLRLWADRGAGKAERIAVLDVGDEEIAAGRIDGRLLAAPRPVRLLVSLDDVNDATAEAPREVLMSVELGP
jgi:hypothetical protein